MLLCQVHGNQRMLVSSFRSIPAFSLRAFHSLRFIILRLSPGAGEYGKLTDIIDQRQRKAAASITKGVKFNVTDGWGHVITAPDQWVARKKTGRDWDFHFAFPIKACCTIGRNTSRKMLASCLTAASKTSLPARMGRCNWKATWTNPSPPIPNLS